MRRLRLGIIIFLTMTTMLQGCTERKGADDPAVNVPALEDVQSMVVRDRDGNFVAEHREPEVLQQLLQGMKEARPSYIEDPEPSGMLYELAITGKKESRTFSVNDLSRTNALQTSVKLYASSADEDNARAWELDTAWVQRLLQPDGSEDEPLLEAIVDEDSDRVIVIANRDIQRRSLAEAVASNLSVKARQADLSVQYELRWTDERRVVVLFSDLAPQARVEFILGRVRTGEGEFFRVQTSHNQNSELVVVQQGSAWSGLRWVDLSGGTVHEHGFDAAVVIQSARSRESGREEVIIYNGDEADTVYRFRPEHRDIADITVQWTDHQLKFSTDYGIDKLYAYPDDKERLYVAKGLQTIYRIDAADGTRQPIYEFDRPVYGMASSPDGERVAVLLDAERNLGPYADLVVLDAEGKVVSEFAKAAYTGHSEGWHFIYPVTWADNATIVVPLIALPGEAFFRGKALYHYEQGLVSKEETPGLPDDALALLATRLEGLEEADIVRALPMPDDEQARYYAAFVSGAGSYMIDRERQTTILLGSGALIAWTSAGHLVVWNSTEGKSVDYVGID